MTHQTPHLIVRAFSAQRGNLAFILPWHQGSGLVLKRRLKLAASLWDGGDPYLQEMHYSVEGTLVEQDEAFERWVEKSDFEDLGWILTWANVPLETFQEINTTVMRVIVETPAPNLPARSTFHFLTHTKILGTYDGETIDSQVLANDGNGVEMVIEW